MMLGCKGLISGCEVDNFPESAKFHVYDLHPFSHLNSWIHFQ